MVAYGSGHFGHWITDEAGLPAYAYTCNHPQDPAAEYPTRHGPSRDHFHLLGNSHTSAIAHNEGYVELFRPDTAPTWVNRYSPGQGTFAGGFGFLRIDRAIRSTLYRHLGDSSYRRTWGMGYFRKDATWGDLAIEQVTFMPYGHDPVLLNLTTLTNRGLRPLSLTYVEYWDVLVTPVNSRFGEVRRAVEGLRVRRSTRFDARRRLLVCSPIGDYPGPGAPPRARDPDPPTIFLAAIDGLPVAGFETSRAAFFGEGDLDAPAALERPYLSGSTFNEGVRDNQIVLAVQRDVTVAPKASLTLAHIYGYGSWDAGRPESAGSATPAGLVERYAGRPARTWLAESLENWQESLIRFETPQDPWLAREAAWNSYYGQALASFSAYTNETFFDQGGCYTYDWGLNGAPRDFCQNALAHLPTSPTQVRGTIRHLTRMCRPDGSLSHAHAGHGRRDVTAHQPSDLQLWLLWLIAEYTLLYRDRAFADQEVPLYPRSARKTTTVRQQVRRSLDYLRHVVGRGPHGILRLLSSDGNDTVALAQGYLEYWQLCKHGESTLNSGLAGVVLPRVAELCRWLGEKTWAQEVEQWATDNRRALADAWNGRWFDRILTPNGHPVGRKQLYLDCQPWIMLAGAADRAQRAKILEEIRHVLGEFAPEDGRNGHWPAGATRSGMPFAIYGPLVWAMAQDDPGMAWEALKGGTLASHAETFPKQWFGIWSGPDSFAAIAARRPGHAWQMQKPFCLDGEAYSHREFPIANGHSANQLLFALARLAGLEADAQGFHIQPRLPFPSFAFEAARVGLRWEPGHITGYIAPQGNDAVNVRVDLPDPFAGRPRVTVDKRIVPATLSPDGHRISFQAFVRGGLRTQWEITTEPQE